VTTVPADLTMPEALDALVGLIRDWRDCGRVTTTAGLKPGLQQRTAGAFSEQALGFAAFRDFVQAAAAAGRIELHQLPSGHWLVLLPGESLDEVPTSAHSRAAAVDVAAAAARPAVPESAPEPTSRLRHETWQCFVDWAPDQRRVWDRHSHRGFRYPVDADGRPAWESAPERFTDMPAADMSTQIGWMREWASALPDASGRRALLASLEDTAHRGRFRQELTRLGLVTAWRAELQRRVFAHAVAWAREHGVDMTDLLEPRARITPTAPAGISRPAAPPRASDDELTRLRALLHTVIDSMSLAELASLPVRAEHLLRVRV
jgi:hypothetical protein